MSDQAVTERRISLSLPIGTPRLEELAVWWAAHVEDIAAVRSFLYRNSQRLTDAVREDGPFATPSGRLEIIPDGYSWNDELVAEVMPALITSAAATFSGTQQEIERTLSLVLEEIPGLSFDVKRIVDKVSAARVLREGGAAAEKLAPARTPRGKLGIR
jgi:hypothetical protein